MIRIYGLKNCDTCRKAAKALEGAELVDIRATPLEPSMLDRALETFGEALVNTRSTTWRGLSEAERTQTPTQLLTRYPALMKRPLIDTGTALHLGWGKDTQAALGL